uniref:Uncharacterized protein n=1 Tax=Florenciella parvula TaxID=236787 RepID=A0A7S2FFP3_9STRA|mmetsp:Transcript_13946/g.32498  ORF Transcript_13946/g.32498 Transcript_13946/m.32498 type:complete len:116 (-) Transcript_13946:145-492(-)|eukprot:CAMPEP_0182572768 /NCGR_PEP_ID=MMETSP1324-20130603/17884_1 /TAXON_ID=236786 /ORGANISM="Florenciella sp., Strain RCC1587" /LENGTH=115 /DNA_ID=CAMNT_0024787777 /DNA_START=26 /DNA_END=373 /DNA_ORIENTATION=-
MAAADGFNPSKTKINDDTLADWLKNKIEMDLEVVPGVGPATANKLRDAGVDNTHALIGKFLMLKDADVQTHMDAFYNWLAEIGISAHRNTIVLSVAEKVDIFMPGTYDASLYADE